MSPATQKTAVKVTPGRWQETKDFRQERLNPFKLSFSLASFPSPICSDQRPLSPPPLSPKGLTAVSYSSGP